MSEAVKQNEGFDRIVALGKKYAEFMESIKDQPEELRMRICQFMDLPLSEIGMLRAHICHLDSIIERLSQDTNRNEGWFVGREVDANWFIRKSSGSVVVKNGHAIPENEIVYTANHSDEEEGPIVTFESLIHQFFTRGDVLTVIERKPDSWRDAVVYQYGLDGSEKWHAMRMSRLWPDE